MTAASGLRQYDLSSGRIEVELKSNRGRIVVVTTAKEALLHTKNIHRILEIKQITSGCTAELILQ